jgi:hypothetical protein
MYKNKSGSDIDKKLEMLEGMKSELDRIWHCKFFPLL